MPGTCVLSQYETPIGSDADVNCVASYIQRPLLVEVSKGSDEIDLVVKSCMAQGFNVGKFHPGQVLFALPWAQARNGAPAA